jgi:threonine dehydrogenase-like Zn-dependent dehydrogenase
MKALCWHGKNDVRVDNVPDPTILNGRDAILKITSTRSAAPTCTSTTGSSR